MTLHQNVTEPGASSDEQGFGIVRKEPKAKFINKDSRSACDLRQNMDFTPYTVPGDHDRMLILSQEDSTLTRINKGKNRRMRRR